MLVVGVSPWLLARHFCSSEIHRARETARSRSKSEISGAQETEKSQLTHPSVPHNISSSLSLCVFLFSARALSRFQKREREREAVRRSPALICEGGDSRRLYNNCWAFYFHSVRWICCTEKGSRPKRSITLGKAATNIRASIV